VGDKDDNIGEEKFIQVINDLLETMKNKYPNFQMIDASIHLDETTPHCHLRGIFDIYNEKHDRHEIFQKKALNQMGFYQPDLEKEDTQFNNAKMSFDKDLREEIAKIVEKVAHIKIDLVPRENTEHLDILEFKKHAIAKDLDAAREDLKQIDKELEERDIPKQLIDVEMKNPIKLGNVAFVNADNYQQMQANVMATDIIKQKNKEQQQKQDDLNKQEHVINYKNKQLNELMETDIVKSKLNELNELKQIKNDVNNAKEEYMNLTEQIINLSNEKKQLQAENQELTELNRGINPDIIQAQMQSLQLENERLRKRTNKLTTVIKEIRNRFELPKFITNLIDKALNTEVQSMDQTR
jgi:plasmid recombination enzyme